MPPALGRFSRHAGYAASVRIALVVAIAVACAAVGFAGGWLARGNDSPAGTCGSSGGGDGVIVCSSDEAVSEYEREHSALCVRIAGLEHYTSNGRGPYTCRPRT